MTDAALLSPPPDRLRGRRRDATCFALIALAVATVAGPGMGTGGLGWSDAPNHVFDGIFLLEFVKAWPIGHIREWAEQFYLRFPALGIIAYYPPGFAAIEALVFAVLGVNILSARLTVALFGLGACWLMYLLGRRWFDRVTGLFAALLLATCPHGVLWMRDVMLEWPATFWLLAVVLCYERLRERPNAARSVALACAAVAAFMTKQTTAFILPVLLSDAALGSLSGGPSLPAAPRFRRIALTTIIGAAGIMLAYLILTWRYTALVPHLLKPKADVMYYLWKLPEIVGWPLMPIALISVMAVYCRRTCPARGLPAYWLLTWFVFCTVISAREPRYFFFALPPIMLATARWVLARGAVRPAAALLSLLVVAQGGLAWRNDTGRLPRYDDAVAELAAQPDADLVLIDAVREGQFIFDVYQNPAARNRLIPLRASKLLYARAAREKYAYRQFVNSESDIVALLDRYGIRYLVIESAYPRTPYQDADPPPRKMLRSLLTPDSRFRLVKSWSLNCCDPIWDGLELRLYAYPTCPPRSSKTIHLSIPAMNKEVTLELP